MYELLGGKSHDKIRMYANGWPRGGMTPRGIAEEAKKVVDQGYTALKFYPFGGEQVAKIERIEHGVALVEAVREAVGSQNRNRDRHSRPAEYLERAPGRPPLGGI